jgi:pteridine reductase
MALQGKTALVTGGAHRVGRAIALALAAAGADVAIHYHRSAEAATATVREIEALGGRSVAFSADLGQVAAAEQLVDTAVDHWGRLDLLVCSAGIWGRDPLGSLEEARWEQLFAVNVRAPVFMAQRAAAQLRANHGCFLAVVDAGIGWSWRGFTPYLSSKAALAMAIQNLANDLAPEARANGVAPGPVLLPEDWTEEQHERAARSTLLKRVGSAEDVADAIVYLAGASYVTGVVLPVDGGQRLI